MADRLILHIGPRKTGTTYLQSILWSNPERLAEQGAFLPLGAPRQQLSAVSAEDTPYHSRTSARLRAELVSEIADRPGTAIISMEVMSGWPAATIREFMDGLPPIRAELVLGVRDLVRQIPAEWQQRVRARSGSSYANWLEELREQPGHGFWFTQDPERLIGRWEQFVPEDRIQVVVLPRTSAAPEELWHRFAQALGLDADGFDLPEGRLNASLGIVQTDLLRRVNAALGDAFPRTRPYSRTVVGFLTNPALLGAPGAERIVLPEDHWGWVSERQAEVIAALQVRRSQVVGDPAELASDPPASYPHSMAVTDGELTEEAVQVIVRMLHHIERTNAHAAVEHRRQARKVRRLKARTKTRGQARPAPPGSRRLRRLLSRVRG